MWTVKFQKFTIKPSLQVRYLVGTLERIEKRPKMPKTYFDRIQGSTKNIVTDIKGPDDYAL